MSLHGTASDVRPTAISMRGGQRERFWDCAELRLRFLDYAKLRLRFVDYAEGEGHH